MKKYVSLFLCAVVLVTLTACGKDTPKEHNATASTTAQSTTVTSGDVSGTTSTTAEGAATDATTTVPATGADTTAPTGGTAGVTTATTGSGTTSTGAPSASVTGGTITTTTTRPTTTTTTVARPNIVLPAIGTDIDLAKKKDRIHVVATSAEYDTDGNILVTLTVENSDKTWITEETDYVVYACYDKNGTVVQQETRLILGCIDTKESKKRSYTFTVPAATAEVRLTRSKITYWSEWS